MKADLADLADPADLAVAVVKADVVAIGLLLKEKATTLKRSQRKLINRSDPAAFDD